MVPYRAQTLVPASLSGTLFWDYFKIEHEGIFSSRPKIAPVLLTIYGGRKGPIGSILAEKRLNQDKVFIGDKKYVLRYSQLLP